MARISWSFETRNSKLECAPGVQGALHRHREPSASLLTEECEVRWGGDTLPENLTTGRYFLVVVCRA